MSSLWTPEGEHRVPRQPDTSSSPGGTPPPDPASSVSSVSSVSPPTTPGEPGPDAQEQAEMAARLEELRGQLLATPVEVVLANHAYGVFELAAIHLSEHPPALEQARLAIDALGALVEGLQGRLGEAEPSLVEALAQIRLAFVQIQASLDAEGADPVS